MSGEFGSYNTGYFDYQMQTAAEDCLEGRMELTRKWGKFFEVFSDIAHTIARAEAADCNEADLIIKHIRCMGELEKAFDEIRAIIEHYKAVCDYLIREHLEKRK